MIFIAHNILHIYMLCLEWWWKWWDDSQCKGRRQREWNSATRHWYEPAAVILHYRPVFIVQLCTWTTIFNIWSFFWKGQNLKAKYAEVSFFSHNLQLSIVLRFPLPSFTWAVVCNWNPTIIKSKVAGMSSLRVTVTLVHVMVIEWIYKHAIFL